MKINKLNIVEEKLNAIHFHDIEKVDNMGDFKDQLLDIAEFVFYESRINGDFDISNRYILTHDLCYYLDCFLDEEEEQEIEKKYPNLCTRIKKLRNFLLKNNIDKVYI